VSAVGRAAAALAVVTLAACAELAFTVPAPLAEFELSGRIAARFGEQAASGNLAWRHAAESDEMLITSPLGQGIARIVRQGGEVVLTTPEGREHRAADAESLTEQVLGFRLPLAGLSDWVRARPAPGPAQARRAADGRLEELEQAGWRIEYLEYDGRRPMRLRLNYPGLELRLAVSEWK
jgi:outer membrane lipoprotein LolB